VNLYEVDLTQNPENYVGQRPSAAARLRALDGAVAKIRQLAPDE
jgi:hypothetical protein